MICYNSAEPGKHDKWKKPVIKDHIWFHFYEMSSIGNSIKTENRLVVTLAMRGGEQFGGRGPTINGFGFLEGLVWQNCFKNYSGDLMVA